MLAIDDYKSVNVKEDHLKRLYELSLSHIGDIPQLDELSFEQEQWFKRRMKGSAKSWEVWYQ